jgi:hypothetical protein
MSHHEPAGLFAVGRGIAVSGTGRRHGDLDRAYATGKHPLEAGHDRHRADPTSVQLLYRAAGDQRKRKDAKGVALSATPTLVGVREPGD